MSRVLRPFTQICVSRFIRAEGRDNLLSRIHIAYVGAPGRGPKIGQIQGSQLSSRLVLVETVRRHRVILPSLLDFTTPHTEHIPLLQNAPENHRYRCRRLSPHLVPSDRHHPGKPTTATTSTGRDSKRQGVRAYQCKRPKSSTPQVPSIDPEADTIFT